MIESWTALDTWIVVVAALSGASCALLGVFLVLRRMSMMGDAISHAVLPGLAVAFLISQQRESWIMLLGAIVVGVLTAALTEWIRRAGKVEEGAAMGVVFTLLFALGLVLIRQAADRVDLDPDCVLYGSIEAIVLNDVNVGGWRVPRAALTNGALFILNLAFVTLLFKELRIAAFDPALATTLGFGARRMHYVLMSLVATTTVIAFESVGSILVIAMLIVPAATAHLLTDRLSLMLVWSVGLAGTAAVVGHTAAFTAPGWFGYRDVSTSTAGMISVVLGLLFGAALLLSPRYGLISRLLQRARLSLRIVREDLLGLLYRLEESAAPAPIRALAFEQLRRSAGGALLRAAFFDLRWSGHITPGDAAAARLSPRGREAAANLVRSHRLWESYLAEHAVLPDDHLHHAAERLEHATSAALREQLAQTVGEREHDPHGLRIPPAGG